MEYITSPQRLREIALADLGPMTSGDFSSFKDRCIPLAQQCGINYLQTWLAIGNTTMISNIDFGIIKTPIPKWWNQTCERFSEDIPHVYVFDMCEYMVIPILT